MSSSSLNPFNFAFLAVGSPDQNGSKHQYHHQPSLGSQSFIQPTAQKRQTLSNSNLDLTASSKTLMDLTSSIPEPIVIPKSTIIEGDVNMYSFITSPPKLSNPIPSIYRIVRSVSPLPANGFIKLEVIDARNSEGTVMWSSMLNEVSSLTVRFCHSNNSRVQSNTSSIPVFSYAPQKLILIVFSSLPLITFHVAISQIINPP